MITFKHKTPIQLRFKDGDIMGHVNNANYLTYIELARIKYFESVVGMDESWSNKQGLILAHVSINYKTPLFIHDNVFVYTRCSKLGRKSIELTWQIIREKEGAEQLVSDGTSVVVCFDYSVQTSIAIPENVRASIENFER